MKQWGPQIPRSDGYAHMCRDGHEQIGHNDSEHEMCPVCSVIAGYELILSNLADALFPDGDPDSARSEFMLDAAGACAVIKRLRAAVAAEREACAKIAEEHQESAEWPPSDCGGSILWNGANIARKIRARGQQC